AADRAYSYGITWGDFDGDGWPDLFVPVMVNGTHLLYRNLGGGRFARVTSGSIAADREANFGTWVDYNNDGHLDLYVVHGLVPGKTNALHRNHGDGTFTAMPGDVVGPIVTDVGMYASSSWGDYDNDGYLDVIVTNNDRNPGGGPNFFYHNNSDGSFTRVLSGSPANDAGAASTFCTWADYDEDGFLDLFVARSVFVQFTNLLYRNNGNSNHWIKVKLTGTVSNRSAIGAKVRVKATIRGKTFWQLREISSGPAFSQTPLTAHFGLGDATRIETLRIEWPSGTVQEFHDLAAKQVLTITEPPRLQALGRLADGSFQLSLTGGLGMSYNVESSTNLARWTQWTSLTITNRTTTITDSTTATAPQRFYRAVSR
ncbi:MAG: CRTAC1 family protein, partial [Verrucomicrobia bacterium]|nr:CRTAC1 family protein [Verrucomicrobiota bacterium]